MFDSNKTRNLTVILSLGMAAILILLVIFTELHFLLAGAIFLVLQVVLVYGLQKYSTSQFRNVRDILLEQLDADLFKKKMAELTNNKTYSVFSMIKEQDYTLGFIYTGEIEEAKERIEAMRSKYDILLNQSAHNQFSTDILDALVSLFLDEPIVNEKFEQLEETLKKIPEQYQQTIIDNPGSFYNLVLTIHRMEENDELGFLESLDQYPIFNQATLLYFVCRYYKERDEKLYNQYHEQLKAIDGTLFFLK